MISLIKKIITDTEAATAVEYGLFLAGISLAIAALLFTFGDNLLNTFIAVCDAIAAGLETRA